MRYAIIADIHANLAAFQAVLDDIEGRGGVEEVWCLGDVVGYGPDPHQCLELLRQYNHVCLAGNHDWAAIGKLDTSDFNPDAVTACLECFQLFLPGWHILIFCLGSFFTSTSKRIDYGENICHYPGPISLIVS